jgi:hypothetical protein
MLTVGGLDTNGKSVEFSDKTGDISRGLANPTKREGVGDICSDLGAYKDCWLAIDVHTAAVCLRRITEVLRTIPVDSFLANHGVEPASRKSRQRVRSANHHTGAKRVVGVDQVPSVSGSTTGFHEEMTMVGENSSFGQEQFWKLLAAVDSIADRQKELVDGAKERDIKLERILEDGRHQVEAFKDFRRDFTNRLDQSEARTKLLETRVEGMAAQLVGVTQQVAVVQGQVNQVQTEFTRLKPAMEELIALKVRVYALMLAFGAVFSLVLLYGPKIVEFLAHVSFR